MIGGRVERHARLLASHWIRHPCDYQGPLASHQRHAASCPSKIQICPAYGREVLKQALRTRFTGHTTVALVAGLASLRPRPGSTIGYATRVALRELGRRAEFPGAQLERPDELIVALVTAHAPRLLALYGVGPDTAALLLIAAGDHPERLRSEATWAHLCAAAPIPASSGKVTRHRLNPGGDRQANHALWRIVITRMSSHPPTRVYVERRSKEGLSKKEIIRCLKRYVAREVYPCLRIAG